MSLAPQTLAGTAPLEKLQSWRTQPWWWVCSILQVCSWYLSGLLRSHARQTWLAAVPGVAVAAPCCTCQIILLRHLVVFDRQSSDVHKAKRPACCSGALLLQCCDTASQTATQSSVMLQYHTQHLDAACQGVPVVSALPCPALLTPLALSSLPWPLLLPCSAHSCCPVLPFPVALSCPPLLPCPAHSCCPVASLRCPAHSCCPVLPAHSCYRFLSALPTPALFCLRSPALCLPCPALPCPVLPCPACPAHSYRPVMVALPTPVMPAMHCNQRTSAKHCCLLTRHSYLAKPGLVPSSSSLDTCSVTCA